MFVETPGNGVYPQPKLTKAFISGISDQAQSTQVNISGIIISSNDSPPKGATGSTGIRLGNVTIYYGKQGTDAIDAKFRLVGDFIYPNVDEKKFACLYSDVASRPNTPVRLCISALVLKELTHMTDKELISNIRICNVPFLYALHIPVMKKTPLCERTLSRFRKMLADYNTQHGVDLLKEEVERLSRMMAVNMGMLPENPSVPMDTMKPIKVRMDSMMVESHAKHMSRIEILYSTNRITIERLKKSGYDNLIPPELAHYQEKGDRNRTMYYRVQEDQKASIQDTRVEETLQEMKLLRTAMQENINEDELKTIPEYNILQRVFEEQTKLDENGNRIPKDKKEISADSVQNPHDATVTFRFKRGAHYGDVLNVAEIVDGEGHGIIISAELDANTQADNKMAEKYVENCPDYWPPQLCVTDGAYNSDELDIKAARKHITIVTTALTGKVPPDVFADFVLNEDRTEVTACPVGHVPVECRYGKTGNISVVMPGGCCRDCPHRDECGAKFNEKKDTGRVSVSEKKIARAKQARKFTTEEGKAFANLRNGVEGVMSTMRRKYLIDSIPVFDREKRKVWIWSAVLAYNLCKYIKYMKDNAKKVGTN